MYHNAQPMPSLTIIMPALNEEPNIDHAISGAVDVVQKANITDYEIIVVTCPDRRGHRDRTSEIVRTRAQTLPELRLLDSDTYRGLGENYKRAVTEARKDYIVLVPGDNENDQASMPHLLEQIGSADMILSYTCNPEVRPFYRQVLSWIYTRALNLLFGYSLKYYNGINVYRTSILREALPATNSFAYAAEIVLNQLRQGRSFVEVPVKVQPRPGESKAIGWRSFQNVISAIVRLRARYLLNK